MKFFCLAVFMAMITTMACQKPSSDKPLVSSPATEKTPPASEPAAPSKSLVEQGKEVYIANCTSCHGMNPALEGPVGPPIKGSSQALLKARVIDGIYPPGYKPKRDSKLMVPMPHLKDAIPALHKYLSN